MAGYGWLGVELFFMISGFVICLSSWGRTPSEFVASRLTRLLPAYVVAVIFVSALLTVWPLADGRPYLTHVFVDMTMLQQFLGVPNLDGVYWTLFVELDFYLLFAAVVAVGVTYRRVVAFCGAWLVGALFANYTQDKLLLALFEPRWAPYFILGITLYLIHRFGPNLVLWLMLAVAGLIAVWSMNGRVAEFNTDQHIIDLPIALAAVAGFVAVLLAAALGWLDWIRWRGLVLLGGLTYPLYLMHMRLSRVMLAHLADDIPFWPLLGLIVATALLLALLVHRLIERPVARVMRQRLRAAFARINAADEPARHRGHTSTPNGDPATAQVRARLPVDQ
jgi:peptidoglycan/LPS O-acetylase OafA/YrhL